ncbi:MAG: HYR domain-containing protein, partial [Chitinophagales bacterium]|nr:HYR domain-containing protein [Chitinophagales bacterium]
MNRHEHSPPGTVIRHSLAILFILGLSLSSFSLMGQDITTVDGCFGTDTWSLSGTDGTGRNIYANNSESTFIRWHAGNNRWEMNTDDAAFAYWHNSFASVPNPPDFNTGSWTYAACVATQISGPGTQSSLSLCSDIVVNSTADNLTAGDGMCTLREAIRNVNAGSDQTGGDCDCGTTITFDASTDNTPIVLNLTGTGEDDAATGDLDIKAEVTIMGNGQGVTIIDGNATDRIFDIRAGVLTTIQSLTIQNGGAVQSGGAIHRDGNHAILNCSQVTFANNVILAGNNAFGGGAIFWDANTASTVTLSQCNFNNNSHSNALGRGGVLYYLSGTHIINNCLFENNSIGTGAQGNVLYSRSGANVTITNSCFLNNSGGLGTNYLYNSSNTFQSCTFSGNSSARGSAIYEDPTQNDTYIINCTITDNTNLNPSGAPVELRSTGGNQHLINNIIVNNTGNGIPVDVNVINGVTINTNTNNIVESCLGTCPTFYSNSDDVICGIATCGNGLCHYPVRSGSNADGTADVSSPIADDICGNARNAAAYNIGSSEVDFTDTEDPVVTCPGNVSQHADNSACNAVVTYTGATATDNCGVVMVSSNPASGSTFNVGTTTVTATASDAAGNMGQCTFTVTVTDNQAPTVTCPPNQSVYVATGQSSTTVNSIPPSTSNDNCSIASTTYSIMGVTTATGNDDASGTSFNVGVSNVAYTVTDPAGLTGMCNFSITVIECGDITVNSTADNLTAGDGNCTLREAIRNANAGTDLTNGDCDCGNTIRFDASTNGTPITIALAGANENANNIGDFDIIATFGMNIIGNGESNTIIDGADLDRIFDIHTTGPVSIQGLTIQNGTAVDFGGGILCATSGADISLDQVTVTNCEAISGGGISMSFINISLAMTSCSVTNNTVAVGSGGGMEFYGSSLMVSDCAFNNNMSGATGGAAEINSPGGTVSFLRSCFVSNTSTLLGGGINHLGGNMSCTNCTFSDNEATIGQGGALNSFAFPGSDVNIINCTAAENTAATGGGFSVTQGGANFTMINTILADNTASGGSGHDLYLDAGTVTTNTNNIVEDCFGNAGNGAVCPTFFSSDDPQLQAVTTCGNLCYYPLLDCSNAVDAGDQSASGVPTTDICGTAHGASTNIGSSEATGADTENPVANCPGTQTVSNDAGQCGANVSFTIPDPTDNCSATSSASPASGSLFNVGTTQVTVTATDGAGNTDQCTFNISVEDTENPTANCPGTQTVSSGAGQCGANVSFTIPNPTDNCTGVSSAANPASGSFFDVGTTQVTVTATDGAGNTDQCTFNVVVNDTANPTANCPSTQTVVSTAGQCGANVSFT